EQRLDEFISVVGVDAKQVLAHLMAGNRGALGVASQSPRGQLCGESGRSLHHLGVVVALLALNEQLPIRNRGCDGFRDGWHRELCCGVVSHGCLHTRSRSSVVVMVASTDRGLAMLAS